MKLKLLFLCITGFITHGVYAEEPVTMLLYNERQLAFYDIFFQYKGIKHTCGNNFMEIRHDLSIDIIKEILEIEKLKIDLIRDNTANHETTRTADETFFKRKYLAITLEKGISIKEESDAKPRIRWDPTHPDAIKQGAEAGYVKYPDIDLGREYQDLIDAVQFFNSIVEYIKSRKMNIIIEKFSINSFEELNYFGNLERIIRNMILTELMKANQ